MRKKKKKESESCVQVKPYIKNKKIKKVKPYITLQELHILGSVW